LSIWRSFKERRNRTLPWIFGITCALLLALLTVPAARSAFHFGQISLLESLIALAAGFAGVAWFEAYKAISGSRTQGHSSTTR